jgi:predicted nucleotide-binding protein (sugar kinase/HSP70/actin superfamily)
MVTVGIPRALLYYQYYPMWQTFFRELGAEMVVSPPTTQAMLAQGSARVVADTCLPAKVFVGHVLSIVDKCDFVFVPVVRSVRAKIYNCAKFLGLPDVTRAVVPESPPILEIEVDINKGKRKLYQAIYQLGRHLNWNPIRVRKAAAAAWLAHLDYKKLMAKRQLTPLEAIEGVADVPPVEGQVSLDYPAPTKETIAIVGHPYLIYDEYINHRLLHRLKQDGHRVLTPEMLSPQEMEAAVSRLVGRAYWTYEEEVIGAGGNYLQRGAGGVIGVMAFGCGPDSLMMDMVRRYAARQRATPFMLLTLDEHTAEAGIVTRLEAFTDMIQRRKRRQTEICV